MATIAGMFETIFHASYRKTLSGSTSRCQNVGLSASSFSLTPPDRVACSCNAGVSKKSGIFGDAFGVWRTTGGQKTPSRGRTFPGSGGTELDFFVLDRFDDHLVPSYSSL